MEPSDVVSTCHSDGEREQTPSDDGFQELIAGFSEHTRPEDVEFLLAGMTDKMVASFFPRR
jgi:hypothetical protein